MPHNFEGTARGEQWVREFAIKQEDRQTPEDITGRTPIFVLRTGDTIHAQIVGAGTGTRGSIQVTPAEGKILVTVDPDATAEIDVSADWGLWLDYGTPTADAVLGGKFYVSEVATPDV